jgi:hypothetical protein
MTLLHPVDTSLVALPLERDRLRRPHVEVAHSDEASSTAGLGLQRRAIRCGTLGFVLTMIAVTAAVAALGGGVASIGAGVMVGGFDGFPFGAMLGVMTYFLKHPDVS